MADEGKDSGGLWDAEQVAAFLKIKTETVYLWASQGRLPKVKVGRLTRFNPDAIRALAADGVPAEGAA